MSCLCGTNYPFGVFRESLGLCREESQTNHCLLQKIEWIIFLFHGGLTANSKRPYNGAPDENVSKAQIKLKIQPLKFFVSYYRNYCN